MPMCKAIQVREEGEEAQQFQQEANANAQSVHSCFGE
jgi:hypothetical protein